MIKVTLPTRTIAIEFEHPKVMKPVRVRGLTHPVMMTRRASHCTIFEIDGAEPKVIARSIMGCHHHDTFTRDVGRKKTLTAALKFTNLSKFEREIVWNTYFDRIVDPAVVELETKMRKELEAKVVERVH